MLNSYFWKEVLMCLCEINDSYFYLIPEQRQQNLQVPSITTRYINNFTCSFLPSVLNFDILKCDKMSFTKAVSWAS